MELIRHPANPLMLPDPNSDWETYNVFNPAVVYKDSIWYMFYRAQGLDWKSRIGFAISTDGIHWNRMRQPLLSPHDARDARGLEDPRVVEIEGSYYMTYTAYGNNSLPGYQPTHAGGNITPMIVRSTNLIEWEILGSIIKGEDDKDHVLFPRKIQGRYAALHRRDTRGWIAYSEDLQTWKAEDMAPVYGPRQENEWDSLRVGNNGAPIETDQGWIVFYHGYDQNHVYSFGAMLLDLKDPTKVLSRPRSRIFWPRELWELRGDVPNVVFSCTNLLVKNIIYIYYGGADHVIGLATCTLDEVLDYLQEKKGISS